MFCHARFSGWEVPGKLRQSAVSLDGRGSLRQKASGAVVKDLKSHAGMEGGDIFFTELWTSTAVC